MKARRGIGKRKAMLTRPLEQAERQKIGRICAGAVNGGHGGDGQSGRGQGSLAHKSASQIGSSAHSRPFRSRQISNQVRRVGSLLFVVELDKGRPRRRALTTGGRQEVRTWPEALHRRSPIIQVHLDRLSARRRSVKGFPVRRPFAIPRQSWLLVDFNLISLLLLFIPSGRERSIESKIV